MYDPSYSNRCLSFNADDCLSKHLSSLYDSSIDFYHRQSFGFFVDGKWMDHEPAYTPRHIHHDIRNSLLRTKNCWYCLPPEVLPGDVRDCTVFPLIHTQRALQGEVHAEVALFIGLTNGLWFIFPILGIYA